MFKKALLLVMVLLAVPNLAAAYNYWSVSTTTSPAGITGAITPPGGTDYVTSGTTTNVVSATAMTADFTVNPAPLGYVLSYVSIDGVVAQPVAANTYRVSKGLKITHTLTAVYAAKKCTITTSKVGNGVIDPTVQVPAGSTKTIYVGAAVGCRIASITAVGATLTGGDGVYTGYYTFTQITSDKSVSVVFETIPQVSAKITTSPQAVSVGNALTVDASSSSASVSPTYTWTVSPTAGAVLTPAADGKTASFSATAVGTYTVTLTMSAAGTSPSVASVAFTVASQALVNSNVCIACHESREPAVIAGYRASRHAATSTISCQACHTLGNDTMDVTAAPNACKGCHEAAFGTGTQHAATFVGTSCIMCHDPHSTAAAGNGLPSAAHFNNVTSGMYPASYMTSKADCSNCHNNGADNAAIRNQWAGSGHAATSELPWIDYDFKTRAGCVQCHTTTGFMAFSTAKVTAAWGVASDKTKEVLTCIACHKNVQTGELRNVTRVKPYADEPSYQNRDFAASNLCANCHSGRNNGQSIQVKVVNGAFSQTAFIAPHYLSAGGSLQAKSGYLFPGRSYAGYSSNSHRAIGMNNAMNTGSFGPCVACHMTSAESHSYQPTTVDQNGAITAITSTACVNCHRAAMPAAALEANRVAFNNALDVLKAQLAASGHTYSTDYPYFATGNWGTGQAGANMMGAAFNYKLFLAEPGAYAHNSAYAKQLIIDSIDAAAHAGSVTGDISGALAALVSSGAITQDQASALNGYKAAASAGCTSCHDNTSGSHAKHLSEGFGCVECHKQTVTNNTTLIKGGKHLDGINTVSFTAGGSFAGGICSNVYCHSNGAAGFTTPTWGVGSANCAFCHPIASLGGAHAAHVGNVLPASYGDTADSSTASEYRFGCGSCHPTDLASHRDGFVEVTLVPTADGSLRSKNDPAAIIGGIGNTGSGIAGVSRASVTCSAAYCHSNGGVGTAFSFVASPNWYGTYTGDRCAMCHGNAPATGAHAKHATSIHTGLVANAAGELTLGHGDAVPATIINCNLCHSATVTNEANDGNATCASCHAGNAKGNATVDKTVHLNGTVDVVFKDVQVVTKAQIKPSSFSGYSGAWTRTSYKVDGDSYDRAKKSLNQAVFGADKSCANVACHNGAAPKWSDRLTCVSCHSKL